MMRSRAWLAVLIVTFEGCNNLQNMSYGVANIVKLLDGFKKSPLTLLLFIIWLSIPQRSCQAPYPVHLANLFLEKKALLA